jgi:hypothetical protein
MRSAYFFNDGMASLLAITEDGQTVDICTIGNEGVVGIPLTRPKTAANVRILNDPCLLALAMEQTIRSHIRRKTARAA